MTLSDGGTHGVHIEPVLRRRFISVPTEKGGERLKGYSFDDMIAMTISRNCSYGVIQQCLEHGLKLPPLVRSTRWPKGSTHVGEEMLPGDVLVNDKQEPAISKRKLSKKIGSGVRIWNCQRCGAMVPSNQSVRVYIHTARESWPQGLKFADICPKCASDVLTVTAPPKKAEREPLYDANGVKIPIRLVARCSQCGELHHKAEGAQIYVERPEGDHPTLHSYLCKECLPKWKRMVKP